MLARSKGTAGGPVCLEKPPPIRVRGTDGGGLRLRPGLCTGEGGAARSGILPSGEGDSPWWPVQAGPFFSNWTV